MAQFSGAVRALAAMQQRAFSASVAAAAFKLHETTNSPHNELQVGQGGQRGWDGPGETVVLRMEMNVAHARCMHVSPRTSNVKAGPWQAFGGKWMAPSSIMHVPLHPPAPKTDPGPS